MFSTPADDAITLHYQPLADCAGEVVGLEALMRWHHRERGKISPEAFVPIFEESGLILPLSRWALKQACLDAASWKTPLRVAVNLSAVQFMEEDLPTLVGSILVQTGLAPERLELEMTEVALISCPDRARAAVAAFRSRGIGVALDDFGTGRSSPAYITDFPFSEVKLDDSLIAGIDGAGSASARSIIHMVLKLAHSLHIVVAAEGVETERQLAFLRDEGCDLIQGFLIGHPAPISSFSALTGIGPTVQSVFRRAPATAGHPAAEVHGLPAPWFDQLSPSN